MISDDEKWLAAITLEHFSVDEFYFSFHLPSFALARIYACSIKMLREFTEQRLFLLAKENGHIRVSEYRLNMDRADAGVEQMNANVQRICIKPCCARRIAHRNFCRLIGTISHVSGHGERAFL